MIFVTVGTAIGGGEFDRLIQKMDEIAPRLKEEVIIQTGSSKYIPKNVKYFNYLPYHEVLSYFKKAKLVIGHCGSGTIINSLAFGTPLIVVPRRAKFAEIVDDHQIELAQIFERMGIINVVYDIEELEDKIKEIINNPNKIQNKRYFSNKERLIQYIRDFLETVKKEKSI